MTATELAFLETTIDIVAEKGLDGFSMKQVTNRVGKAEALLYKYYGTKDNLLMQCFLSINRQIAQLFNGVYLPENYSSKDLPTLFHNQWERYFWFMVDNGNRSLFYYAYRESTYLKRVLMSNNPTVANDMNAFMTLVGNMLKETKLSSEIPTDYIWLYLLEGTGTFVKQAIRGGMSHEEIDVESIWKLLSGGLMAVVR